MQLFETYTNISEDTMSCALAVGNFDGVHRGHQALLTKARDIARESGCPFGVLTFEPHPARLFRPDEPPSRITPCALKLERLATHGADYVFCLPFDWDFASLSADDFVRRILRDGLKAAHIIAGYDFKFGQLRKGTAQTIRSAGLPVTIVDRVTDADTGVFSSSRVRQLLRRGDIATANAALGWDWEMRGKIFRGDRRGRDLGYPTANMRLGDTIHPAYGVYACRARIAGEDIWRPGAANIGIRPMFAVDEAQVETFIFDFDRDIYGEVLHVRPVKHLRSEAKFNSLDALVAQMEQDCAQARAILSESS